MLMLLSTGGLVVVQGFPYLPLENLLEAPTNVEHSDVQTSIGMVVRQSNDSGQPLWNLVHPVGRFIEGIRF